MTIEKVILGYVTHEENYGDKTEIIQQGSKGDWAFVILEGEVKVKKKTPKGWLTVDTLRQGDIFGEMALITKGECLRTASVFANGPVKVGVLDTDRVIKDYESISPQMRTLLRALVTRLKDSTDQLATLVS
ncbi:MAG: hypothetical protein DRH15_06965, partial [Deltaproteobacteria bacterium]